MEDDAFLQYLLEKLDVDPDALVEVFERETGDIFHIAHILIQNYNVDKMELGKIWGSYLGFAYVDPNNSIINPEFIERIGINFIQENKALPLYKFGKAVTVCASNPKNPFLQDKMEKKLDEIVSLVFCFPFDIDSYLRSYLSKK